MKLSFQILTIWRSFVKCLFKYFIHFCIGSSVLNLFIDIDVKNKAVVGGVCYIDTHIYNCGAHRFNLDPGFHLVSFSLLPVVQVC